MAGGGDLLTRSGPQARQIDLTAFMWASWWVCPAVVARRASAGKVESDQREPSLGADLPLFSAAKEPGSPISPIPPLMFWPILMSMF